ncbi:MAG: acetyl-CoA carboxylase, carboxyltransferase subunit beta [Lachnobacterium sp.]|jgi:acetyl-CoA carboxylase carboxyl transferase subunit beta|nr:acetyl-CoA carboxylase, carboxyltransferase subunit beta [Lachnobacterium sp.]
MEISDIFKKKKNRLDKLRRTRRKVDAEETLECKRCHGKFSKSVLKNNNMICPDCNKYFSMSAEERIRSIADEKTFKEHLKGMYSVNPIDFLDYDKVIEKNKNKSKRDEAVITGVCKINGIKCAIAVMESQFMMGSMGTVVGERISAITEIAGKHNLPLIIFSASGGARMQEGMFSLMQMAKTSTVIEKYKENGGLFLSVYTNPTTGGVSASFAALGNILIAEPDALICFAGPRVIEQTIGEKLPEGFQHSEFLLKSGMLDMIVERQDLKDTIYRILVMHNYLP